MINSDFKSIKKLNKSLSLEAEMYNYPRNFGENFDNDSTVDMSEILPVNQPKLRRAKVRRNRT